MAYSIGSGDYTALLAAVLAHAVADGWLEAGGLGTGWPISKGNVRGVDYTTFTSSQNDYTEGAGGGAFTARWLRLGLGSTTALATTDAGGSHSTYIPNMHFTFSEWHIFSETAVNDHIHVIYKFSNGSNVDVYGHFSFGEVDKAGLTYGSIAYATGWGGRGYAASTGIDDDWNGLHRCRNGWDGSVGKGDDGTAIMTINVHATSAPTPNGTGGWPSWDTNYYDGDKLWGKCFRISHDDIDIIVPSAIYDQATVSLNLFAWNAKPPAQTGTVTMMPIPMIFINGTGSTSRIRWMGVFPNVRKVSMENVVPGQEISYGSETWKIFPLLRNTANSVLNTSEFVTSGRAGIAFKKVI